MSHDITSKRLKHLEMNCISWPITCCSIRKLQHNTAHPVQIECAVLPSFLYVPASV